MESSARRLPVIAFGSSAGWPVKGSDTGVLQDPRKLGCHHRFKDYIPTALCGMEPALNDFTIKRSRKISLASALSHENSDLFGYCLACHRNRLILREDIIAMNLPGQMRIDERISNMFSKFKSNSI